MITVTNEPAELTWQTTDTTVTMNWSNMKQWAHDDPLWQRASPEIRNVTGIFPRRLTSATRDALTVTSRGQVSVTWLAHGHTWCHKRVGHLPGIAGRALPSRARVATCVNLANFQLVKLGRIWITNAPRYYPLLTNNRTVIFRKRLNFDIRFE